MSVILFRTLLLLELQIGLLIALPAFAFDLSGIVVDSKDKPVEGASVWVRQGDKVFSAASDGKGTFAFANLVVNSTEIVALKDGYAIAGITTVLPGPVPVKLRLNEATPLKVSLIGPRGAPVADARVKTLWVSDIFHVYVEELRTKGFPVPRSNELGILEIPWVTKTTFANLIVAHQEYAETPGYWMNPEQKNQIIQIDPGYRLTGRVTAEDKTNGIASVFVCALRKNTKGIPRITETRTDSEGFYSLLLAKGEYDISVRHPDYPYLPVQQATLSRENVETAVDFRFPLPGWVVGKVMLTGQKPLPAVPVSLLGKDRIVGEGFTQEDGSFRIAASQERVAVQALSPRGLMPAREVSIIAEVEAGKDIEVKNLEFKEIPAVSGKILPIEGGVAQRVLVSTLNSPVPCWAICDKDGLFTFRLPQIPAEGKLRIRAEHAQRFMRKDADLSFSLSTPVEISLEPFEPDLRQGEKSDPTKEDPLLSLLEKQAPALECDPWFNAEKITLTDLQGKVVVLSFLGANNAGENAIMAVEELRAQADLYKGLEDVVFLGVMDSAITLSDMDRWVRTAGIQFPIGRDKDLGATFAAYNMKTVPRTILISKKGVVAYVQTQGRLPELIKDLRRK